MEKDNPVTQEWGFWDETWSHWYGPYKDEEEAKAKCKAYAKHLETGEPW